MPSIFEQLRAEYEMQRQRRANDRDSATDGRAETTIGADVIELEDSQTTQSLEDSFLGASNVHGLPRGREALDARQISETAPFQTILNAIVDQLTGGDLVFPSDDGEEDSSEAELKTLVEDVLRGPHHRGLDFDDLLSAWVADMAGPGNAYAELLGGGDLPVAALKPVDPLTVRHNVSDTGAFKEPAFYQAPFRTSSGGIYTGVSDGDVVALDQDDLLHMAWPGSTRSNRIYPLPPAMQVKEWLEIIHDSTTHHSRFYSDNELPPGVMTAREATQSDVESIREELEAAKGDPRSAPVVGTDARWVEVGGSAVDLDVIQEQQWFIQLVAAAFGIPKTELGLVEDVNRNTSETQLTTVHKRVTSPIAKTVGEALTKQLLPQFDLYQALDQPFEVGLRFSDPRQERAQEEHVRERYTSGGMTYREYREAIGDDMSDVDTTVELNGQVIDYGEYPKPVVESLLTDARNDDPPGTPTAGDE